MTPKVRELHVYIECICFISEFKPGTGSAIARILVMNDVCLIWIGGRARHLIPQNVFAYNPVADLAEII